MGRLGGGGSEGSPRLKSSCYFSCAAKPLGCGLRPLGRSRSHAGGGGQKKARVREGQEELGGAPIPPPRAPLLAMQKAPCSIPSSMARSRVQAARGLRARSSHSLPPPGPPGTHQALVLLLLAAQELHATQPVARGHHVVGELGGGGKRDRGDSGATGGGGLPTAQAQPGGWSSARPSSAPAVSALQFGFCLTLGKPPFGRKDRRSPCMKPAAPREPPPSARKAQAGPEPLPPPPRQGMARGGSHPQLADRQPCARDLCLPWGVGGSSTGAACTAGNATLCFFWGGGLYSASEGIQEGRGILDFKETWIFNTNESCPISTSNLA